MAGVVRGRANAPNTGIAVPLDARKKEDERDELGKKETERTRFGCSTTFCRLSLKRNAYASRHSG